MLEVQWTADKGVVVEVLRLSSTIPIDCQTVLLSDWGGVKSVTATPDMRRLDRSTVRQGRNAENP